MTATPRGDDVAPRHYHRVGGDGGELRTALVVGVIAEVLVLACALAGVILRRRRAASRTVDFATAAEAARRAAFAARIMDAHIAELSELAVDDVLVELGLERRDEPDLGIPDGFDVGQPGELDPP
jgi:hypothetical protein